MLKQALPVYLKIKLYSQQINRKILLKQALLSVIAFVPIHPVLYIELDHRFIMELKSFK